MTLAKVLNEVKKMEAMKYINIYKYHIENRVEIMVKDFEGFDEDWSEILVWYDEEAIFQMEDMLKEASIGYGYEMGHNLYIFKDGEIEVSYASEEI